MVIVGRVTPHFSQIEAVTNSNLPQLSGLSEEVFDNLPVAIFERFLDECWTVKCISVGITQILGESSKALLQEDEPAFADFVLPVDFLAINQSIRDQLLQKQSYAVEYRLVAATGQICWVQEQGKGIYSEDGTLLGVQGILCIRTAQSWNIMRIS